jgi:hypothetical protein
MRKVFLDVTGLVLFSEEYKKAFFVDGSMARKSTKGHPIPPHYSLIAIRTDQHDVPPPSDPPRRPPHLRFHHDPQQMLVGSEGEHAVYVLARDNDRTNPTQDRFFVVTLENVTAPGSAGSLGGVLDVRDADADLKLTLPKDTINGSSRAVAVILDTANAVAEPLTISKHKLRFGGKEGAFAHTVRLIYDIPDDVAPVVVIQQLRADGTEADLDRFPLTNARVIGEEGEEEGWHLFAGDVPLSELFNLSSMQDHTELHHFELIYDLYGHRGPRPIPENAEHAHPPGLGDPGFCGPPVRG